jgi:hypothetical protein
MLSWCSVTELTPALRSVKMLNFDLSVVTGRHETFAFLVLNQVSGELKY